MNDSTIIIRSESRFSNIKTKIRNSDYSSKRVFLLSSPIIFLLIVILIFIVYGNDVGYSLRVLYFMILSVLILIPYIIPVFNILFLCYLPAYKDMLIGIVEISSDTFIEVVLFTIAIIYIVLSCVIVIASIIMLSNIKWEKFGEASKKVEKYSVVKKK